MAENNREVSAQDINAHCYAAQGYVVTDFEYSIPVGSLCDFGGGPMRVIAISNREEFMRQYPLMVEAAGEPMACIFPLQPYFYRIEALD